MSTYFVQCRKCGAGMGQWVLSNGMSEQEWNTLARCEPCKRIEAWMPELVQAVIEALKQTGVAKHYD